MKAVIMAGGKGTRLRPLTSNLPKPMVPLLGRPCMEYIVDLLKKHGITDIAVTLQYLPESIKNYFGDGSDFGVNIVYFEEKYPLGTAGSVKNCEEFLDERFIVISGDALTDFHLNEAIQFHCEKESTATLVLSKVSNPLEYGVVMTNEEGRITRFLEKPTWSEVFSDTVNTGIYILEPHVLDLIEKDVEFDFSKDLFPMLLRQDQRLMGYTADGYWSDIGNLEIYRQAQFDMLDKKVDVTIKATEIQNGIYVEEDAVISNEAKIDSPAFIGRGSYIEAKSKIEAYTVVGRYNTIKKSSILRKSILWDHNYLGSKIEMDGVTLCNRSFIDECTYLAEGVIMGDDCRVGANAHIKSGVKIWPDKEVEANSTVHSSIIWGTGQSRHLFGAEGIRGVPNIDITPEFAARLASAVSTQVKKNHQISLSACSHPFSQLIKSSTIIGLNAAGIHTMDFGTTSEAGCRFGIQDQGVHLGIHIFTETSASCTMTIIRFYDKNAFPIDKGLERKIENSYWQEDFARVSPEQLGTNKVLQTIEEDYVEGLKQVHNLNVEIKPIKIVLDCNPMILGKPFRALLQTLKCQLIHIHTEYDFQYSELIETVQKNKANFGIRFEQDGTSYTFVTDEGKIINDDEVIALHLLVHSTDEGTDPFRLGIPVSAPREIELLAIQLQTEVIRTKETMRDLMVVGSKQRFQPLFDGMYSLVRVIGHLSKTQKSLSEILLELPSFHMARQDVYCDWRNKGKVMRMMMEEAKGKKVDLLDGIKMFDNDGWVLIIPDMDQPHVRVVTQAASKETAATLAQLYAERIQQLQMI